MGPFDTAHYVLAPNTIKSLASLPNFLPVLSEFVQIYLKIDYLGTSPAVQWLKDSTLPLQRVCFIPAQGTKILHAVVPKEKKEKKTS